MDKRKLLEEIKNAKPGEYSQLFKKRFNKKISDRVAADYLRGIKILLEKNITSINNNSNEPISEKIYEDGSKETQRIISVPISEEKMRSLDKHKTEKMLLKKHGFIPTEDWKIDYVHNSMWNTQSTDYGYVTSFSSKIKASPRQKPSLNYIKEYFNNLKVESPKVSYTNINKNSNQLLEIDEFDVHFGKLCWKGDSGENFDIKIAEERLMKITWDIINQYKNLKINKILFPIGQDFFNYDTTTQTTTAGTLQDTDVRWKKMFVKGYELIIKVIETLYKELQIPIIIVWAPGNHDEMLSFALLHVLFQRFLNNESIQVDSTKNIFDISKKHNKIIVNKNSLERKYIKWGKCAIGYAHDLSKKKEQVIFPAEASSIWSDTEFREIHKGHKHIEEVRTYPSFKVRDLPSFTGTDSWHYKNGYVKTLKQAQSFLWDKEKGLINIKYHTIYD